MKLQFGSVFTRNYLCALALVALSMAAARSASAQEPATSDVTTTGGAVHSLPYFTTGTNIQSSAISQLGGGVNAKVGIGTTSPASRLHISAADTGANGFQSALEITNTASTNDKDWWLRVGAPGTNTPNGGFSLGDDDAYWFVITFNGNVGLGLNVTNPTNALQLADGAYENGGVWTNASDRNLKENFIPINNTDLLTKINGMTISTWNYKSEGKAVRHLGPVAQDFYAAFSLGQDDKHISTVDEGGVALAAIQELYRMVVKRDAEVASLEQANSEKAAQVENLKAEVKQLHQLQQTVELLSTRLSTIESGSGTSATVLRASR